MSGPTREELLEAIKSTDVYQSILSNTNRALDEGYQKSQGFWARAAGKSMSEAEYRQSKRELPEGLESLFYNLLDKYGNDVNALKAVERDLKTISTYSFEEQLYVLQNDLGLDADMVGNIRTANDSLGINVLTPLSNVDFSSQIAALEQKYPETVQDQPGTKKTTTPTPPRSTPAPSGPRLLKLGRKGDDVKEVQEFLVAQGHLAEDAYTPGNYDAATKEAVEKFQEAQGIGVDGIIGRRETWPMIAKVKAEEAEKSEELTDEPDTPEADTDVPESVIERPDAESVEGFQGDSGGNDKQSDWMKALGNLWNGRPATGVGALVSLVFNLISSAFGLGKANKEANVSTELGVNIRDMVEDAEDAEIENDLNAKEAGLASDIQAGTKGYRFTNKEKDELANWHREASDAAFGLAREGITEAKEDGEVTLEERKAIIKSVRDNLAKKAEEIEIGEGMVVDVTRPSDTPDTPAKRDNDPQTITVN